MKETFNFYKEDKIKNWNKMSFKEAFILIFIHSSHPHLYSGTKCIFIFEPPVYKKLYWNF